MDAESHARFGLFGRVERTGQLLTVLEIWIALVLFSRLWPRSIRFGPAEWLWRFLTYRRRQPSRLFFRKGPTLPAEKKEAVAMADQGKKR